MSSKIVKPYKKKPSVRPHKPNPGFIRIERNAPPEETQEKGYIEVTGVIVDVSGDIFLAKVEDKEFICHLSGKMRKNRIRLTKGDSVKIELSVYGDNKARKGRIVKRLENKKPSNLLA